MDDAGRRIAELRDAMGVTQDELAAGIGTDQGTISKIERGKAGLSWERAVAISDFLGVPLERIRSRRRKGVG